MVTPSSLLEDVYHTLDEHYTWVVERTHVSLACSVTDRQMVALEAIHNTGGQLGISIKCFAMTTYMGILDKLFSYEDSVLCRKVVSNENKFVFVAKQIV